MKITFWLISMMMCLGVATVRPERDGSEANRAVGCLVVAILFLVLGAMVPA